MNTIALEVHTEKTQMCVTNLQGEIICEKVVDTNKECLRRAVGGVASPKRVVFENGTLSALVQDALKDLADEILVCDPTRNALIARAEDSSDERDAQRLGLLARAGGLQEIYIPSEPYRTIRSLVSYESKLTRFASKFMIKIKAFCRQHGVRYRGKGLFRKRHRQGFIEAFTSVNARFQIESLYRMLDAIRREQLETRKRLRHLLGPMAVYRRISTVPGIGPVIGAVLLGWIVDPNRFKSRSALCAYAGLGLKQNITNWQPTTRARASHRGQSEVKRVLFIAARVLLRLNNTSFAQRYHARREAGWEDRKAIRDLARTLLLAVCHIWRTGEAYDDARIKIPVVPRAR